MVYGYIFLVSEENRSKSFSFLYILFILVIYYTNS